MVKGIGLLSGGLDSVLAVRLLMQQNIEVTGITFVSPFFGAENAQKAADSLGIELIVSDISQPHFELVKNPPHGYGRFMNPCPDCHAMMVKFAGMEMDKRGMDFIFTGEVLGQRPFSQNPRMMKIVADNSGYGDVLIRPLCARLMKPTTVELDGRVDRSLLLDIQGRSRRRQLELAESWGVTVFNNPAGGCKLTENSFSVRLREALANSPEMTADEVKYLRTGRQFRIAPKVRLILGKHESENDHIAQNIASTGDYLAKSDELAGPTGCIHGVPTSDDLVTAARIVARYISGEHGDAVPVTVRKVGTGEEILLYVQPFSQAEADKYYIDPTKKKGSK